MDSFLKLELKFITTLCFAVFLVSSYYAFIPISLKKEVQSIDISPGRSFFQIGRELKKKHLIRSELAFKLLVVLFFYPKLPVGEYDLSASSSLWSQFQKIRKGESRYDLLTVAEGLNSYEIVEILKQKQWEGALEFSKLIKDKKFIKELLNEERNSLEGYLFPETYRLQKYMSAKTLIKNMVKEFLKSYSKIKSSLPIPLSRHEVVTLASLVEKETADPKERPLIASVFYNRLKIGMKLQTDPTILYSLFLHTGVMPKNIRKKDILFSYPYNTYVIKGLPPGPIANPGRLALKACFSPEPTKALYFVSRNDGTHVFSNTYPEHQKAVYEYQIKPFKKSK